MLLCVAGFLVAACATGGAGPSTAIAHAASARDTSALVPAGYGSLRQDDVALHLQRFSLQLRLIPLDESVIRLLSPDSYRALRSLRESHRAAIEAVARRATGNPVVWYVTFFSTEPGETRFSPMELGITNVGRDFRPLDVVPLTPGFGEQRLRQRESQSALVLFDPQLDVNQPLAASYETATTGSDWDATLARLERERTLVRSRAASARH